MRDTFRVGADGAELALMEPRPFSILDGGALASRARLR
jgi:hypothetical protein